jgi:hypothetical protein
MRMYWDQTLKDFRRVPGGRQCPRGNGTTSCPIRQATGGRTTPSDGAALPHHRRVICSTTIRSASRCRPAVRSVSPNGQWLSCRGRGLPANASGLDTHRALISRRFDCRDPEAGASDHHGAGPQVQQDPVPRQPPREPDPLQRAGDDDAAPRVLESGAGAVAVASPFWRPFLTEIDLCNVCACQEILRRNGRGQGALLV